MSKKILLVEDEALIAMSEAQMLKKHGYEVVTVYNGENAIEAVDSDPEISLILMDIDLGNGMDGTEAAEQILKKKDIPEDPAVNERLNEINRTVQRLQREAGNSFVSRTTLKTINGDNGKNVVVFRCVIMNPMTNMNVLREILDEQEGIYKRTFT